MTQRIDDRLEKVLFGKYLLAYLRGKGSHKMVPVIIHVLLDLPESESKAFYSHMGHSKAINNDHHE